MPFSSDWSGLRDEGNLDRPRQNVQIEQKRPVPDVARLQLDTVVELTAVFDNSKMNIKNPDASVDVTGAPGGEVVEGWLGYTLN